MNITKVVPRFNPKADEIGLYLTIFERQLNFLSIPELEWIPYLISSLPTEIAQLIARDDEEDSQDYLEEVFLRYALPRRLISDNGSQFVNAVMQQTCNFLGIKQDLIPVHHPQFNPLERKNRDLKPRIAILVRDEHDTWDDKLPMIRFALNTAKCETINHTQLI
ncbi:Gypsy retrotransposon integrase-like protein 1 [Argiope bruennichi]|uniref:Gypsy retrotransposon integrase-like protein 1 n=1 Tax=Argiope bruennichi TaxID=94029 RepID=A0A8T0ETF4_ARGBR|nr:Gypsy retrotransposon integrase-like protein 1 [Argiope bruennichi]